MVYPENFESKIKFDKIRQFVQKNCLSDMGRDLVEAMKFSTEPTEIRERLEETQEFTIILENFRLCLIQRTLEELPDFEVMTWQLCRMLRSALNCFQVTRFCVQK